MTREQAISRVSTAQSQAGLRFMSRASAAAIVDSLVALDLLKLDQSVASIRARAIGAIYTGAGAACDAAGILRELEDAGLQIVENPNVSS
jgi:hypothetical protein